MKPQDNKGIHWLPMISLLTILLHANLLQAQDSLSKKEWHYLVEPYFMFANLKGTVGLGSLPDADVDEKPSDIFDKLEFGAMLYAEAHSDRWAITSDFTYMKLGADVTRKGTIINTGHAELKQTSWELAGLRKFLLWLEGGIALQLNSIKSDVGLNVNNVPPPGNSNKSATLTETWVDPSVIARVKFPIGHRFSIQWRGNIGGFGIGSDLYWQLQAYVDFHASKLISLSAGYRLIDVDYEKGSDKDRFKYDLTTFGPVLRVGFNFH